MSRDALKGIAALLAGGLVVIAGCANRVQTIAGAFPEGERIEPWVRVQAPQLRETAATTQPDDEAVRLQSFAPRQTWEATYQHARLGDQRLTVRISSFDTAAQARDTLTHLKPPGAAAFAAGDGGYWADGGLRFAHGRLIISIMPAAAGLQSDIGVAVLATHVKDSIPPELAADPR